MGVSTGVSSDHQKMFRYGQEISRVLPHMRILGKNSSQSVLRRSPVYAIQSVRCMSSGGAQAGSNMDKLLIVGGIGLAASFALVGGTSVIGSGMANPEGKTAAYRERVNTALAEKAAAEEAAAAEKAAAAAAAAEAAAAEKAAAEAAAEKAAAEAAPVAAEEAAPVEPATDPAPAAAEETTPPATEEAAPAAE